MKREEKRMKKRKEKRENRKEKGDEIRESPTYVRSDLEEMKVPQLKKIAQEINLPRYTCGVKGELIDALMEFYDGRDAENLHPKNKQIYKQDYGARKKEPVIFREYLNMLKRKPDDFYDFKQNQVLPEQLQTIEKYRQYIKNNFSVEWKALQIVEEYARAVSTGEEKTKPPPPPPPSPTPSPPPPSPKSPPPKKQKKTDAEKKADKKKYDKARNDAKKARINAIHARLKKEEAENKQMGDEDKDAPKKATPKATPKEKKTTVRKPKKIKYTDKKKIILSDKWDGLGSSAASIYQKQFEDLTYGEIQQWLQENDGGKDYRGAYNSQTPGYAAVKRLRNITDELKAKFDSDTWAMMDPENIYKYNYEMAKKLPVKRPRLDYPSKKRDGLIYSAYQKKGSGMPLDKLLGYD